MKSKIVAGIITTCLILAISSGMLHAGAITTYSDEGVFDAATFGFSMEEEDFTADPHFFTANELNTATAASDGFIIQPGVTYSTDNTYDNPGPFNINVGGSYDGGFLTAFRDIDGFSDITTLTMDYTSGPISAFGFDTNGFMGSSFEITINFLSGSYTETFDILDTSTDVGGKLDGGGDMEFFGFTSEFTDIMSVTISGIHDPSLPSDFAFALDNHTYGFSTDTDPPVVPEPSTILLLGAGMIGLAGVAVRRKSKRRNN